MQQNCGRNFLTEFSLLFLILVLGACATSLPPEPAMPPVLPDQEPPPSEPEPPELTASPENLTVPSGIALFMEGAPVQLNSLPALDPTAPSRTVQMQASPDTPYRNVERILERLHDLGYLIDFSPLESP